jgi:hypothetical protein
MSQYQRQNEEAGCGTLIISLILAFFGRAILQFVLLIALLGVMVICGILSSIGNALFGII